ncbi:tetratricopeptide repeat domain-containing protein [Fusarium austroafricanum]|uniref:Tetratricopeptide repeat domain-containing protein n=1 Tax=Fusarium austroafricanum TaxID=2364996 RepID=A0A8H4NZW6_9HYPO|nr:tetratricopeptide repeat domain-containing protein [Fusarium austroafricanum]
MVFFFQRPRDERNKDSDSTNTAPGRLSRSTSLSLSKTIAVLSHDTMKVESSVIAVPGYCTPAAPEWGMKQELQKAAISLDSVSNLHITNDKDTLLCHNQVLHSCAKIAVQKQASKLSSQDVSKLATLAATFEEIANVPILSVFEYEEA